LRTRSTFLSRIGPISHVRAAASAAVERADRHDAQRPAAGARLAQALRGVFHLRHHGATLEHERVGALFHSEHRLGAEGARIEIEGRCVDAKMDAQCGQAEQILKDGRQQVLPGVLLHVIEASGPVERSADSFADRQATRVVVREHVRDPLSLVHHVQHR
jgi:hypothetical protein